MSGSGGGSGRIDVEIGTQGEASPSVCSALDIQTFLNSPNEAVIKNLKQGDQLDVNIKKSKTEVAMLIATYKGQEAGSLTPAGFLTLFNCIERGFKYVAVVLDDVKDAAVRVRIRGKM